MAEKHLASRERQIKTPMRYHPTPVIMVKTNETSDCSFMLARMWGKELTCQLLVTVQTGAATIGISVAVIQKAPPPKKNNKRKGLLQDAAL